MNGVIPLAIPSVGYQVDVSQLLVRNAARFGIVTIIQAAVDLETIPGSSGGD